MKRLIVIAAMAAILAGCDAQPRPAVPMTVKVPVPVPCQMTLPQAPSWAVDGLPLGSGVWAQMAALRAERLQRIGFETELTAAIRACQ